MGGESGPEEEKDAAKDTSIIAVLWGELKKPGGVLNLFVGMPSRATFFFFVIGL